MKTKKTECLTSDMAVEINMLTFTDTVYNIDNRKFIQCE